MGPKKGVDQLIRALRPSRRLKQKLISMAMDRFHQSNDFTDKQILGPKIQDFPGGLIACTTAHTSSPRCCSGRLKQPARARRGAGPACQPSSLLTYTVVNAVAGGLDRSGYTCDTNNSCKPFWARTAFINTACDDGMMWCTHSRSTMRQRSGHFPSDLSCFSLQSCLSCLSCLSRLSCLSCRS